MNSHSNYNNKFRADIQGLRAIAVAGVVIDHLNLIPHLMGGYAGVDIFFVISGFLITDHLVRGMEADGHIRFGEFYARRARRILPASLFVVLLTLITSIFLLPVTMRTTSLHGAIAAVLYVPNYLFAYRATNYFTNPTPSLYQHYWSLGVEEQFYLVWPLILATTYWLGTRTSRKISRKLCSPRAALITAVILVGVFSAWLNLRDLALQHPSRAFYWATGRAWEFAVGGFIALIASRMTEWLRQETLIRAGLSWIGLAFIGMAYFYYPPNIPWPGIYAALPVFGAALIILSGTTKTSFGAGKLLEIQPLPWIGALSYSLYLVHWPLIQYVKASQGYGVPLSPLAKFVLASLSIFVAWLLYRFVENPVRYSPWLRPTHRTFSLAGVSSLGIVLIAVGLSPIANYQQHHLLSRLGNAEHVSKLTDPPSHITTFVPRNLDPAIGAPNAGSWLFDSGCLVDGENPSATPHSCYYGNRKLPLIALVGDSEAAAMEPAFTIVARKLGLALKVDTAVGCEFLEKPVAHPGCSAWRQAVLTNLRINPPDFIVIVQQGADGYVPSFTNPELAYQQGLDDFLSQIGNIPLVIIQIPLLHGFDVPTCLSTQFSTAMKCSVPAKPAVESDAHKAEAALAAKHPEQVHVVNLTGYFCGPDSCPPIIGNTRVWLDGHHPTAAFATLLGPIIANKLVNLDIKKSQDSNSVAPK